MQQARDLSELTSYLICRGLYTGAREAMAEAEQLIADQPETREIAYIYSAPLTNMRDRRRLGEEARARLEGGRDRRALRRCGDGGPGASERSDG